MDLSLFLIVWGFALVLTLLIWKIYAEEEEEGPFHEVLIDDDVEEDDEDSPCEAFIVQGAHGNTFV